MILTVSAGAFTLVGLFIRHKITKPIINLANLIASDSKHKDLEERVHEDVDPFQEILRKEEEEKNKTLADRTIKEARERWRASKKMSSTGGRDSLYGGTFKSTYKSRRSVGFD